MPPKDRQVEKQKHVEKSEEQRLLKCLLTEKEKLQAGSEMTDAYQALEGLNNEFETVKQEFKGKIGGQESAITRLSALIRAGYEHRQVKCSVEKDFGMGTVTVIRLDSGDTVEARPMSNMEAQMGLEMPTGEGK